MLAGWFVIIRYNFVIILPYHSARLSYHCTAGMLRFLLRVLSVNSKEFSRPSRSLCQHQTELLSNVMWPCWWHDRNSRKITGRLWPSWLLCASPKLCAQQLFGTVHAVHSTQYTLYTVHAVHKKTQTTDIKDILTTTSWKGRFMTYTFIIYLETWT